MVKIWETANSKFDKLNQANTIKVVNTYFKSNQGKIKAKNILN